VHIFILSTLRGSSRFILGLVGVGVGVCGCGCVVGRVSFPRRLMEIVIVEAAAIVIVPAPSCLFLWMCVCTCSCCPSTAAGGGGREKGLHDLLHASVCMCVNVCM
jgi:hypothetical protein